MNEGIKIAQLEELGQIIAIQVTAYYDQLLRTPTFNNQNLIDHLTIEYQKSLMITYGMLILASQGKKNDSTS